ncbi:MAG: TIGR00725 family protein, partial [Candidatus Bathyarchaeia archaeon]
MIRKKHILVIGFGEDHCTPQAYNLAFEVGKEIAKHDAILITGGLGGVMEAASKGAKEEGGLVVGIIPFESKEFANPFCDVVISTGIGYARDFITAYTADALIVIGGGVGTLIEACVAY